MEKQSDSLDQEPTTAEIIDAYARNRMASWELVTWTYDEDDNSVTFYVPDDVETFYPEQIAGASAKVVSIPRPVPFNGREGLKSTNQPMVRKTDENTYRIVGSDTQSVATGKFHPGEHSIRDLADELAGAELSEVSRENFGKLFSRAVLILGLDNDTAAGYLKTSRPTIERWRSGESAPHRVGRPSVFRKLANVAREQLQQ